VGVGLYYGVLLFNLTITWWIGEMGLLAMGILIHAATFLLLYIAVGATRARQASAGGRGRS
jgi:putative membrane protein